MSLGPEHRRAVRTETIVSTLINSLEPAGVIWFAGLAPPETILGPNGIIGPMGKAAGLATLLMTLILTLIVRARVRKGTLPALDRPSAASGLLRWLPRPLLLRAIVMAIVALVLLLPVGLLVVAMLDIMPLTRIGFLIFNLSFGAIVGIVMTRLVVLPALADTVPA